MTEQVWVVLQREMKESQDEQGTDCAWCMTEEGIPLGDGSHGICDEHAEQLVANLHAARGHKE